MSVRAAQPRDAAEVAGVHVRSWQVGYRGLFRDDYLDGLRAEDRPQYWGRGIGRSLIAEARTQLSGQGLAKAVLWVLVGNERARRFYRADGWQSDGHRREECVWGVLADEIRFRRCLP